MEIEIGETTMSGLRRVTELVDQARGMGSCGCEPRALQHIAAVVLARRCEHCGRAFNVSVRFDVVRFGSVLAEAR